MSSLARMGWWMALFFLAVSVWLLVERNRSSTFPSTTPTAAAPPPSERTGPDGDLLERDKRIAELEAELRTARSKLQLVREKLQQGGVELEEARRDRERYRAGLEAAVGELNQLNTEIGSYEAWLSGSLLRWLPGSPASPVQPLGAPTVTVSVAGFVVTSGLVHNGGDTTAMGQLEISLLGPEGPIDTRRDLMYLAPGATERYDITFAGIIPVGPIAASARWIE